MLCNLARLARVDGRRNDAEAVLDEATARSRRLDDAQGEALAVAALGNCVRSFGEPDRALHLLEQAIVLRRAYGDRRAVGLTETAAALARATAGDLAGAETIFRRTHERFRAADDAPAEGSALLAWGLAVEGTGDSGRAADLLVAGAEVWERGLMARSRLGPAGGGRRSPERGPARGVTRLRSARRTHLRRRRRDAGGCIEPRSSGC